MGGAVPVGASPRKPRPPGQEGSGDGGGLKVERALLQQRDGHLQVSPQRRRPRSAWVVRHEQEHVHLLVGRPRGRGGQADAAHDPADNTGAGEDGERVVRGRRAGRVVAEQNEVSS